MTSDELLRLNFRGENVEFLLDRQCEVNIVADTLQVVIKGTRPHDNRVMTFEHNAIARWTDNETGERYEALLTQGLMEILDINPEIPVRVIDSTGKRYNLG